MPLEDYRAEMERCSQCSYCKWVPLDQVKSWRFAKGCPSIGYNNFLSYSARGRYAVSLSLLNGKSTYSPMVQDIAFKCQTCGSCDITCKVCRYNLEPLQMTLELKAKLVRDGQSIPQFIPIIDSLHKERNMMQQPGSERGNWARGLEVKDLTREKAGVVFHAGCRLSFDAEQQQIAQTAVTVLKNAGVDIGIMGKDENCCGGRAYQMGYQEEMAECARSNIKAWRQAGVKTIVTSCSDCYHAFKRLYPKFGSEFEVLHTVEIVDRLIKEGRIKFTRAVPVMVTYHDPCHLGRQGEPYVPWDGVEKKIKGQIVTYEPKRPRYNGAWGIYQPPRHILRGIPGLELVEMERIKEYAWCCGAGGGVREAYPDYSRWTAAERIEEVGTTGAAAIVSACPWCEKNFADSIKTSGGSLKVFDVIELVKQAMQ